MEQRKVDLDQVKTVVWSSLGSGLLRIACMLRTDRCRMIAIRPWIVRPYNGHGRLRQ
jgi:hypothetical protein